MKNAIKSGAILTVDLAALKQNYRMLTDKVASRELAAVVKANAYGLGITEVSKALSRAGCSTFFVATLEEGIELREVLSDATLYVFHGVLPGTAGDLIAHKLIPILNSFDQIEEWRSQGNQATGLHVDTGMSRLGLTPDQYVIAQKLKDFRVDLVLSHLACSEEKDHPKNAEQLNQFKRIQNSTKAKQASLAASSGIFLGIDYQLDLCRAGASLYGINPTPTSPNPMAQVIRLQAQILQIRSVDTPQTVGYGATHQATKPTKIATLAIGYADGYMRSLGNLGKAFIDDYEVPVVGRISMDLTTVDISNVPDALLTTGTLVDLIGPNNPIDKIAEQAGTIGYEILTSLSNRIARRYISDVD
jgi:alanine racemase